jgi:hypothetical protein
MRARPYGLSYRLAIHLASIRSTIDAQRAERHVYRMAGVTDKVCPTLNQCRPMPIWMGTTLRSMIGWLPAITGCPTSKATQGSLNLNVLAGRGGRTLIAIDQRSDKTPAQHQP